MKTVLQNLLQGKPFGHPLHPFLIHFPLSLFLLSFIMDIVMLLGWRSPLAPEAVLAMIVLGIVMAVPAALTGVADYQGIRRDDPARRIGLAHMLLNLAAVALFAISAWVRRGQLDQLRPSALAFGLSAVAVLLLGVSGYLGGKMVYEKGIAVGRHRRKTPAPTQTVEARLESDGTLAVDEIDNLPAEGETLRVNAGGVVLVITCFEGRYHAFQEFCTHRYGPLSEGTLRGGEVECPWHGSCFDIRTGKVTRGPAKENLRVFEVQLREDGRLRIGRELNPA